MVILCATSEQAEAWQWHDKAAEKLEVTIFLWNTKYSFLQKRDTSELSLQNITWNVSNTFHHY